MSFTRSANFLRSPMFGWPTCKGFLKAGAAPKIARSPIVCLSECVAVGILSDLFGGPLQCRLYNPGLSTVKTSFACIAVEYLKRDRTLVTVNDSITILHQQHYKT